MAAVLPFDGFLALLRAKGFAVGLNEHLALANLMRRWEGTNSPEFADALAALIARNEDEAVAIRRLFGELYSPPPLRDPPPPPPPPPDRWAALRKRIWLLAALAAIAVLVAGGWWWTPVAPAPAVPTPPIATGQTPPAAEPPVSAPVTVPEPPAPALPDPPRLVSRDVVLAVGGGLFLLALAGSWSLKVRDVRRAWLRRAWATAADALPAPFHFPIVLRDPVARLPRIDIEDAATILGRALIDETRARELDARRSIRLTLRRGLMPSFVFRPRRVMPTIIVLQDVAETMRVWKPKVELFLSDLRRQGIPLERHYFRSDPRFVADAPRGPSLLTLDEGLRRRPGAPVLVISDGDGLSALPPGDDGWRKALERRDRKAWLTPVSDAQLWPVEIGQLPARVWPMTRRGLAQAARDLAGVDAALPEMARRHILDEGRVSLDDIERMKRLAALVPYPTTDLLELLRRRFAPDISDAVVLPLLQESGRPAAPVLRLNDAEVKRLLAAVRFESPRLEADVRHALLSILEESKPLPGSAAFMRWDIAVAIHRLALADLGEGDRAAAAAQVEALSRGPLWEEARKMISLTPRAQALDRQAGATVAGVGPLTGPVAGAADLPPGEPPTSERLPWVLPGIRELVPASVLTVLLVAIGWTGGVFPLRALEHVTGAYQLALAPGSTTDAPVLELQRAPGAPPIVPVEADLYQGNQVYRRGISLASGAATVALATADLDKHYQVRARLTEGNLALSDAVWVPGRTTTVVIDAQPWADVTIQGNDVSPGPFTTPFSAALKPGTYRLRFENGGLTAPMERTITVDAASRTYRFTMPDFDPGRTASQLSRGSQSRTLP